MIEQILMGELPSDVFKSILKVKPELRNADIAELLFEAFPNVGSVGRQAVWHWQRPGKLQGLSDENLNSQLLILLRDAKYL